MSDRMSKAFTREETDGPDIPEPPPLVAVLPAGAKNYITAKGAQSLRDELARLVNTVRPSLAAATENPDAKRQLVSLDQRIHRLEESLQSAEVVAPPEGEASAVRFGATVTIRETNGEESIYRIVGVDETDIDRGWVSWLSPIARALMNAKVGDRVRFRIPSGETELEVVAVNYYA
jgi:transcription elongation factor GreB